MTRLKFCPPLAALSLLLLCAAAVAQTDSPALEMPSSCAAVPGPEPWKNASQSPECRAMEVIHALTPEQKMGVIGFSFGPPQPSTVSLPRIMGEDGPNGIARGPFPGPPPPMNLGTTAFPNEIAVAATWSPQLAADFGEALAEEWRGKGLNQILGPTLNITRTWHWGRSGETYGEDPLLTGTMASAEISAIQGEHVLAMLKHFTANDQDADRVGRFPQFTNINEVIPERALEEIYFPGFRMAIEKSSPASAMCAYNQVNGEFPCNSKLLLSHLRQWGFAGFITPDAVFALHDPVAAVEAGVDRPGPMPLLQGLRKQGKLPDATLDRMAYHVLLPMFRIGLFDYASTGTPQTRVSTPAHLALSRHLIQEGSVLLKNDGHLLPLRADKTRSIAVIGVAAGPQAITGEEGPLVYVEKLSVPADAIIERAGSAIKVSYTDVGAGIRPLPIVPADVLRPVDGAGQGLTGTYFKAGDFSGTPVATRLMPTVDFHDLPVPELGKQVVSFSAPKLSWSARWTGTLTPPATGNYVFSLAGGGTARLLLDGKTVVLLDKVNFNGAAFGTAMLTAGKAVQITLKHSNDYAVLGSQLHLGWMPPTPAKLQEGLAAARQADVAIVFAGEQIGEGMDKDVLNLPGDQDALITAVAGANPHTVVVLNTSTAVAMPWLSQVRAVLETWYPGQESGAATAGLLFGDADPGGRLPMTFPAAAEQGPATQPAEYPGVDGVAHFDEGIFVGYRWYDEHKQTPLFPFGFGMSYATFRTSNFQVKRMGDVVRMTATVSNTANRDGSETVELYVQSPAAAKEPPLQLKGFAKVMLKAGQSQTVQVDVPVRSLRAWDESTHDWKLFPGAYRFRAGESSRSLPMEASIMLGTRP